MTLPSRARRAVAVGVVFAAYVIAGKLGLRLAVVHASATAVWPPAGIAVAALLLGGRGLWPAILAAAFVVNATTEGSLLTALGIAVGNTLEAVTAVWVLSRLRRFDPALARAGDALSYIAIAAALSTVVSATIGVTALCASGVQAWPRFATRLNKRRATGRWPTCRL